jgi:hypothetical protein
VNNIKVDVIDTGWVDVNWSQLIEERVEWEAVVNMTLNITIA